LSLVQAYSLKISLETNLIGKTPQPRFPWFIGCDHRMTSSVIMLRGVFVGGIITAADMTTGQADSQVNPRIAGL
jgi:hypothetical protein